MKIIFKHFTLHFTTCFCASEYEKKRKEKKHKTVEHCASSPTEPVFDFCLSLLCKKESPCTYNLRMHWNCIIVQYVCVRVTEHSNKLTWYYGCLSHWHSPAERQVGLGFPKFPVLYFVLCGVCVCVCVRVYDDTKHLQQCANVHNS